MCFLASADRYCTHAYTICLCILTSVFIVNKMKSCSAPPQGFSSSRPAQRTTSTWSRCLSVLWTSSVRRWMRAWRETSTSCLTTGTRASKTRLQKAMGAVLAKPPAFWPLSPNARTLTHACRHTHTQIIHRPCPLLCLNHEQCITSCCLFTPAPPCFVLAPQRIQTQGWLAEIIFISAIRPLSSSGMSFCLKEAHSVSVAATHWLCGKTCLQSAHHINCLDYCCCPLAF